MSRTPFSGEWRGRAKCLGTTPQKWDARLGTRERSAEDKRARYQCDGCTVKLECALDALHHKDVGVIRAGVVLRPRKTQANRQETESTRRLQAVVLQEQEREF